MEIALVLFIFGMMVLAWTNGRMVGRKQAIPKHEHMWNHLGMVVNEEYNYTSVTNQCVTCGELKLQRLEGIVNMDGTTKVISGRVPSPPSARQAIKSREDTKRIDIYNFESRIAQLESELWMLRAKHRDF